MTLWAHLDELRSRVIRALLGVLAASAVGWAYSGELLRLLIRPPITKLVFSRPAEPFIAQCKIALVAGLAAALPWVLYQIWAFIAPGLRPKERAMILKLIAPSYALFLAGCGLGFFVVGPWSLKFLLSFSTDYLQPYVTLDHYLSYMTSLAVGSGVLFQLPIVLYILAKLGLVTAKLLAKYRRHVFLAILILAAIVTPSPDVVGQLLVAIPAYFLYEISIIVVWFAQKRSP